MDKAIKYMGEIADTAIEMQPDYDSFCVTDKYVIYKTNFCADADSDMITTIGFNSYKNEHTLCCGTPVKRIVFINHNISEADVIGYNNKTSKVICLDTTVHHKLYIIDRHTYEERPFYMYAYYSEVRQISDTLFYFMPYGYLYNLTTNKLYKPKYDFCISQLIKCENKYILETFDGVKYVIDFNNIQCYNRDDEDKYGYYFKDSYEITDYCELPNIEFTTQKFQNVNVIYDKMNNIVGHFNNSMNDKNIINIYQISTKCVLIKIRVYKWNIILYSNQYKYSELKALSNAIATSTSIKYELLTFVL